MDVVMMVVMVLGVVVTSLAIADASRPRRTPPQYLPGQNDWDSYYDGGE